MSEFVAYYFAPTSEKRRRSLELEAQQEAVAEYVDRIRGQVVCEFTEAEPGNDTELVQLKRAVKYCRLARAMLVVVRLDQRVRDADLFAQLLASGTDFLIADLPKADRPVTHVIVATAEYGRQVISERARRGLRRAKAAGKTLGNPDVKVQQPKATAAAQKKLDVFAREMIEVFKVHDPDGTWPATRLADILNANDMRGAHGGLWSAASVISIRRRIGKLLSNDASRTAISS